MIHDQECEASPLKLTIPDWAIQDRPREKYLSSGFSSLSDAELIAILLRSGTKSESAVGVARNLLSTCNNNLNQLSETHFNKLLKINGIGKVKAITLLVAFELGKRSRVAIVEQKRKIINTNDLVNLMQTKNACLDYEEFWVIFVNQGSSLLGVVNFGRGGLTSTSVDIRLILMKALELKATGLFICHNHPSGELHPSKSDTALTTQMKEAARLLSIQLLDHVIICKENYYSFLENEIL
ncbi:MAG: DNA repair protein RadC [Bacteroidetes bacterium]|nr:DNA repair protein RadC [Bacteroidota bacterium]MCL2303076.1 DNA repair protein RadC [Lentimicrobiaceae bacterium]